MNQSKLEQHRQTTPAAPVTPVPAIAVRKSCNPDGIGLSHYVLMDRKKVK